MASYIPVPRDLTRVKSKILFNLTRRQLLCFGIAALIGVPSFLFIMTWGWSSWPPPPASVVGVWGSSSQPSPLTSDSG